MSKLKSGLIIVTAGSAVFATHALYSGNPRFYSEVAMPTVQKCCSAERAHNLAISAARLGFYPRMKRVSPDILRTNVLGYNLDNPIGLAAGFDKHCEAMEGLLNFGFGFIEVGAVTPKPQPGNAKPRVFRLEEDNAVINRYGFNSIGHEKAVENYNKWLCRSTSRNTNTSNSDGKREHFIGVNLGKNKETEDPAVDYIEGVKAFGPLADFLVINVSSPNTPGLRTLQGQEQLKQIIKSVVSARDSLKGPVRKPIFVKIAPDLTERDCVDIASVVAARDSGIDGLVISNTTITRPPTLKSSNKSEQGGLSGEPVKNMSTKLIQDMYRLTGGRVTIIGVGGVFTGQDALDKIKAGASLVQIYTALAYHGPPVVNKIKKELANLLEKEGFTSVSEAVGINVRGISKPANNKATKSTIQQ